MFCSNYREKSFSHNDWGNRASFENTPETKYSRWKEIFVFGTEERRGTKIPVFPGDSALRLNIPRLAFPTKQKSPLMKKRNSLIYTLAKPAEKFYNKVNPSYSACPRAGINLGGNSMLGTQPSG